MREIGDMVRMFERGRGELFALATLVEAHGSSYRRPGARMLIAPDGSAVGSLSGGCIEAEVIEKAREVMRTGEPAWLEFDTRRGFGCHGGIEILVEVARPDFLAELAERSRARRSATVGTVYARGAVDIGSRLLGQFERPTEGMFIQRIDPPLQLLMIGDGPDSAALKGFCGTLGWDYVPMESATEIHGPYDAWTAAIVKTHNYGRDFAALRALLPLGLKYVGLLGPRRRREQLLGDLLDIGLEESEGLFAPAGLDLGGDSPEAIALAIIAEIQAVFAEASAQPLRIRQTPIHGQWDGRMAAAY